MIAMSYTILGRLSSLAPQNLVGSVALSPLQGNCPDPKRELDATTKSGAHPQPSPASSQVFGSPHGSVGLRQPKLVSHISLPLQKTPSSARDALTAMGRSRSVASHSSNASASPSYCERTPILSVCSTMKSRIVSLSEVTRTPAFTPGREMTKTGRSSFAATCVASLQRNAASVNDAVRRHTLQWQIVAATRSHATKKRFPRPQKTRQKQPEIVDRVFPDPSLANGVHRSQVQESFRKSVLENRLYRIADLSCKYRSPTGSFGLLRPRKRAAGIERPVIVFSRYP